MEVSKEQEEEDSELHDIFFTNAQFLGMALRFTIVLGNDLLLCSVCK